MKYISIAAFVLLLAVSWMFYTQPKTLSGEQQTQIQSLLQEYLRGLHKDKNPSASELENIQMFLSNIENQRMTAEFSYKYLQPSLTQDSNDIIERKGYFILKSSNGIDWNAKLEQINETGVEFAEVFVISSNNKKNAEAPASNTDAEEVP